jgi:transcriptional regulator with XRE-family HTH domain
MERERQWAKLTQGEALRFTREAAELSQGELARRSGLSQSTISAIESGRVGIGVERAEKLARALRVHPAVLAFPNWRSYDRGRSRKSA